MPAVNTLPPLSIPNLSIDGGDELLVEIETVSNQAQVITSDFKTLLVDMSRTEDFDGNSSQYQLLSQCSELFEDLLWCIFRAATEAKAIALDPFDAIASGAHQHPPFEVIKALDYLASTFPSSVNISQDGHTFDVLKQKINTKDALDHANDKTSRKFLKDAEDPVNVCAKRLSGSRELLRNLVPKVFQAAGLDQKLPKFALFLAIAPVSLLRYLIDSVNGDLKGTLLNDLDKAQKKIEEDTRALDEARAHPATNIRAKEKLGVGKRHRDPKYVLLGRLRSDIADINPRLNFLGRIYDVIRKDIDLHLASLRTLTSEDRSNEDRVMADIRLSEHLYSQLANAISNFRMPSSNGTRPLDHVETSEGSTSTDEPYGEDVKNRHVNSAGVDQGSKEFPLTKSRDEDVSAHSPNAEPQDVTEIISSQAIPQSLIADEMTTTPTPTDTTNPESRLSRNHILNPHGAIVRASAALRGYRWQRTTGAGQPAEVNLAQNAESPSIPDASAHSSQNPGIKKHRWSGRHEKTDPVSSA